MNTLLPSLAALLLVSLAALHAAETIVTPDIDREKLDKWSASYRGGIHWPDHVHPGRTEHSRARELP